MDYAQKIIDMQKCNEKAKGKQERTLYKKQWQNQLEAQHLMDKVVHWGKVIYKQQREKGKPLPLFSASLSRSIWKQVQRTDVVAMPGDSEQSRRVPSPGAKGKASH